MHKHVLAIMSFLILVKAVSADPVKATENLEQKDMQKRVERYFRNQAENFGIETEGKDLKKVRKELHIVQAEQRKGTMEK